MLLFFVTSFLHSSTLLQDIALQTVCNLGLGPLGLCLIGLGAVSPWLPVLVVVLVLVALYLLLRFSPASGLKAGAAAGKGGGGGVLRPDVEMGSGSAPLDTTPAQVEVPTQTEGGSLPTVGVPSAAPSPSAPGAGAAEGEGSGDQSPASVWEDSDEDALDGFSFSDLFREFEGPVVPQSDSDSSEGKGSGRSGSGSDSDCSSPIVGIVRVM